MTSQPNWRVDIRLEEILHQDQRVLPVCAGGRAAAPGEEYAGALEYLHRLDRHRHEFPFEALGDQRPGFICQVGVVQLLCFQHKPALHR
jgi:hypothetical protein